MLKMLVFFFKLYKYFFFSSCIIPKDNKRLMLFPEESSINVIIKTRQVLSPLYYIAEQLSVCDV